MRAFVEIGAWIVTLGSVVAGIERFGRATRDLRANSLTVGARTSSPPFSWPTGDSLIDAAALLVDSNIFRRDRVAASPVPLPPPAVAQQAVVRPPRPTLAVQGIAGGPPWSAVVVGVPGFQSSVVLQPGDSVGGVRVVSVRRDTVIARAADSTYTLTLRR